MRREISEQQSAFVFHPILPYISVRLSFRHNKVHNAVCAFDHRSKFDQTDFGVLGSFRSFPHRSFPNMLIARYHIICGGGEVGSGKIYFFLEQKIIVRFCLFMA
jgi:hypothetical protein